MQRVSRAVAAEQGGPSVQTRPTQEREVEESQTWVLFSPPTEGTTASYLTETEHSVETAGPSRVSDSGSFNTVARSSLVGDAGLSLPSSAIDDVSVEDDGELDSLDSHLPEFRSLPGEHGPTHADSIGAVPVFPSHDGLGSFRLDRPTIGRDAQDQIYQFERFNPRRVRRRLDSIDPTHLDVEPARLKEAEKRERIEAWRLEHSRVLLDEVQRETRRRRKSLVSLYRSKYSEPSEDDGMTWHDEDATDGEAEQHGILAHITRTVVKDILGIDDRLLSILIGETLVDDEDELSQTPRASHLHEHRPTSSVDEQSWQLRILETVSRELGKLVSQLTHHPGAFSAYSRMQSATLPYAGLPAIPEAADAPTQTGRTGDGTPPSVPEFQPTVPQTTKPINIPGKSTDGNFNEKNSTNNSFTKEEWEQDLDIKLVFRYLLSRFTSRGNTSSSNAGHLGTTSMQDAAARVARVRQYHPLVARSRPVERRPFRATTPSSPIAMRPRSSCASQSTRRSARRSSCSSRHYWDIGGSLGTGSVIGTPGPMGSWGEV
jgi:hypothetical protein